MKKTLENLIGGAKKYAKKTAVAIGLLGALASYQPQEVKGDVYLTMEPQNGIGFLLHNIAQTTPAFDLHIYADNTTEIDPTAELEFKIKAPSCVEDPRSYIMDPYVNSYDDLLIPPSKSRDFFYPKSLNLQANYVWPAGSKRSIAMSAISPQSPLQGVRQRKGLVGIIRYTLKEGTPLGKYPFEITGIAKKSSGTEQPTKGSVVTLNVVPNYNYFDNIPLFHQDVNYTIGTSKKVPHFHISSFKKQVQVQTSPDLKDWTTITKSPINVRDYLSNLEENQWAAFDFIDKDAEFADKRFYRLYVAP